MNAEMIHQDMMQTGGDFNFEPVKQTKTTRRGVAQPNTQMNFYQPSTRNTNVPNNFYPQLVQ